MGGGTVTFEYKPASPADLEAIWNKDIAQNAGDGRYTAWKSEYIGYNRDGMARTFVVLRCGEPVGQGTLLFSPECKAVAGRTVLADGKATANIGWQEQTRTRFFAAHRTRLLRFAQSQCDSIKKARNIWTTKKCIELLKKLSTANQNMT